MKIAVAAVGNEVAPHFGHAENFIILNTDGQKILSAEIVAAPEHKHGVIPQFAAQLGADVIIAGGMCENAYNILKEKNIEVILGADGKAAENADNYLKGKLKSNNSFCKHHHHDEEH